jgi:hypothetical protein
MHTLETPSATAATMTCPRCGALMVIRLVEPTLPADGLERHTFKCTACSLSQGYLVASPTARAVPAH